MGSRIKPVYENEIYCVFPARDRLGYVLYNKVTDVHEGSCEKFPSAVSQADVACALFIEIRERKK